MKSSKRIISFILAFATGFSLYALPASADYISSENFGSWVTRNSPEFIQRWTHGFFGAGCTVSDDGRHHASSFQTDLGTGYYDCICSECGHSFRAYYQDSYDQAVSELPAGTITSDGGLIWQSTIRDWKTYVYYNSTDIAISDGVLSSLFTEYSPYSFGMSGQRVSIGYKFSSQLFFPIAGTYTTLITPQYREYDLDGNLLLSYDYSSASFTKYSAGVSSFKSGANEFVRGFMNGRGVIYLPAFKIVPMNSIDVTSGDTYNIDNRVGSLVGNYTYEGDNGTQIIAEDIRIVNETDQSVYNPVTNETYYYNEYTYNYGDRSYDFSFGDRDDHVSVTYGDDCVTIEDGDHTYTIYYTTASNHEHSYRITNVIDPTCIEQGKIYKFCSECGDELIEVTDALGHDWQITEQTAVDYVLPEARCPACESQYFTYELVDEVFYCVCQDCGEEWSCNADVMEGHTTYTCSRCGEERTETNQEQDLSLFEAIGDLLADTFEWITDKLGQFINSLSGLSESFSSRIESIIESVGNYPLLFGAFLAGMPDDLMNIVWFGVIALVFVLVWKKFFS